MLSMTYENGIQKDKKNYGNDTNKNTKPWGLTPPPHPSDLKKYIKNQNKWVN